MTSMTSYFPYSMHEQNNGALLQLQLATGEAILRHGRLQMHQIFKLETMVHLVANYTVMQKKGATKLLKLFYRFTSFKAEDLSKGIVVTNT